ncbi:hypothetical protein SERLA73DRAFT_68620 [Serpula lacrymans var. lacrymans S7.3]|uniref:Uncharacterized protein n=2 Tax=Serpula lacrymans var. lacrymans TaxID=341189 RepID=F8PHC2_SERL3|nr:uncharacterized protein SERLADRAFT_432387 [Serpula lacrymans var. lacrymans S7.9]EGO04968.1 hypothetical protein SERLA73DRAFT_68620 [Serpula lacrymans var. lacrymans S7.3]EGO30764.1 hypothetical protein SERLADRAFT_432387 [Serpula lacrymans var. lacrymans S7.9]
MSTSNSTGFPVTTYSVPGEANMLANNRVSFPHGQQHNQANVSDAIELMSAKDAYIYLFYKTEKRYPHAYHALSSMHTFLAVDLRAFVAQQSGLEYLSGTPDGKMSFGIFGTTLEDELLEWANGRGKGIFGIRREDLANRSAHTDRARQFATPKLTYHIVAQQPPSTLSAEEYIPTVPTSPILQGSSPSSPRSIGSNPKPPTSQSPPPRPQEVILQIPATINVDDADMINQLYAGTYDLGDDNPPTPQSDTLSNTRQKYHQDVHNNAPYCQRCGWSDHCTYYCKAYYCPNCDRHAPGHSFNWCPIRMENKDRVLMEGLHGDVSYDDSYNMDGEGTKFW